MPVQGGPGPSAGSAGPGFNIAQFKAYLAATGIVRNNSFLVIMPLPVGLADGFFGRAAVRDTNQAIQFACDTVNFPTTGVQVGGVQRYGYGAVENRPTIPRFSPLACTFLCDGAANMQRFFTEWVKIVCNYDFGLSGMAAPTTSVGGQAMSVYEISYKPEYAVDINLQIFNEPGQLIRSVMFREAFPTAVQDIPLSWGRRDDYIKIPVEFAFVDWYDL